jgi:predicted nucleotidyltransferase
MTINLSQKQKIASLAEEFNLKLVLLFGSQASQRAHRESDVDFGVLPEKSLSFEEEILLNTKLSGLFQDKKIIDLVNLKKAPPLLLKQILDNHKILYQKNSLDFSNFEALVLQKYREATPLFEMRHEKLEKLAKSL